MFAQPRCSDLHMISGAQPPKKDCTPTPGPTVLPAEGRTSMESPRLRELSSADVTDARSADLGVRPRTLRRVRATPESQLPKVVVPSAFGVWPIRPMTRLHEAWASGGAPITGHRFFGAIWRGREDRAPGWSESHGLAASQRPRTCRRARPSAGCQIPNVGGQ